ncbi:MAG: type II secretion system secretin GspD [Myxococcota bacterium]
MIASLLGVPALLFTLAGPAWAQDDGDEAPKPERIRPSLQPGAQPGQPGGPVPGGAPPPPPPAPAKGEEASGTTPSNGAVVTKKVPCVPSSKVTIDFVDAPLMDVTKYMAEITCRNFILGKDLEGQVTIISHQQVTVAEAYEAYLSALEVAGYTTVSVGGSTKIVQTSKAANAPLRVYEGDNIPGTDNFVTQIIELDNVTVGDISTVVKELSGPSAKVIAYAPTNTLILTDAAYNIRRVYRIIKQMDVAAPKSRIEVIPIRFATASEVEAILEEIYGVAATTSTSTTPQTAAQSRAAARRGRNQPEPEATASSTKVGTEGAFISKIMADERTNSLIILANDEAIAKVKELVAQVDVDIDPASRAQIHVLYLDHANAEDVASVISNLASGSTGGSGGSTRGTTGGRTGTQNRAGSRTGTQNRGGGNTGGGPGQGGFGGPRPPYEPGGAVGDAATSGVAAAFDSGAVRITADENTNSLVLLASPEDFRVIKSVIDRLDIPRRQVYVEAVVVEVGSDDELDMGVGYHFGTATESGGISYGSAQMNASSVQLSTASLLSGLAMGVIGQTIPVTVSDGQGGFSTLDVPAFGIALNALASNSEVNILSNPNILVLDNEEATINVGRNVPFPVSAGRDNNGQPIVSYQREDVGITLAVTPQINESNYVTLEMNLEVAEVEEDSSGLDVTTAGFITSKRETENVVVVRDNQTIVIGGLIGNTQTEVETKIPVLGDIPLLGVLFRGKRNTERKTNLLIFLTPHVINEPEDLEEVYRVKMAQREEFLKRFYGKSRDEQEEELSALLRGSMNLIDEPSMYRTKEPPKPMDSAIPDESVPVTPTSTPAEPAPTGTLPPAGE